MPSSTLAGDEPGLLPYPDATSHASFATLDHRPWPLPDGRWAWRQSWVDLLFAHWPVPLEAVRLLVPPGLDVQTFDGVCWLGVVPFRMEGVAPRPFPDIPGLSVFPELNVRLYVERDGKPGVFFLSLDTTNRLAVTVGRHLYHVPYFLARMAMEPDGDGFAFHSTRRDNGPPAVFDGRYRPTSDVYYSTPGTLEHFLTERYCLYAAAPDGTLSRTEVHHAPWPLQTAAAEIAINSVPGADGLPVEGPPALLHFARRVDVAVWGATAA